MIKRSKKKISLPDPYDDDYEAVFDALDRLSKDEQAKILQRIGILGPDGQLAPAYADDGGGPEPSTAQTASSE